MAFTPLILAATVSAFCVPSAVAAAVSGLQLPTFPISALSPSFEVWVDHEPSTDQNFLGGKSPRTLNFPLQRTEVNAQVNNGVAHASVTQIYHNDGDDCVQSRYIFPLPTKAAISALSMRIGNRTVIGEIRTRVEARQEFEAARAAGQSASLLDQERPNVFAMELANILPGETTEVVVEYSETLSPIDGVYAFTFPAVVGPRYGQGWAPGEDTSNLSVTINLSATPSCLGIESVPEMQQLSSGASLTNVRVAGTNTDIVIKFWFTEDNVDAQFLLASRGQDKYFSLAVQPPQRQLLTTEQISPREFLFILDVSGSMTGYPIDLSKTLMKKLLQENVRAGDSLNIMLFAGGSAVLNANGNVEATSANIDSALQWLDENMYAGGGTELLPALRLAFTIPRLHTHVARTIIVMTDGYVTVEREAFDLVRNNLGEGNVFALGIGSSVNRYLIEGLARVGYGEPFVATSENDGNNIIAQLQRYIDTPVLTQVALSFEGSFKPKDQEPPFLPDVFASRPIQIVGKWDGELSGSVKLQGRLADGTLWEYAAELADIGVMDLPALPLLWARSRIAVLGDYGALGDNTQEQITALGLSYSLMTQYTSFVAVDSDPSGPDTCRARDSNTSSNQELETENQDMAGLYDSSESSDCNSPIKSLLSFCVVAFTFATN